MDELEILAPKNSNKKIEFPHIKKPLLQPPFTEIVIAPTKSGKSVLLLNKIKNVLYGYNDNVFEELYYISPTIELDSTLKAVFEDDSIIKIHEEEQLEHLDTILNDIIKNQKEKEPEERNHILIVLDDMIDYMKTSKRLAKIGSYNRHYKISLLISSQTYNSIPLSLRKQASSYIFFHMFNEKDLKNIEDEIGTNFKDFMKYYREATADKYNFLFVDNRDMKLYHNFKKLLWEK